MVEQLDAGPVSLAQIVAALSVTYTPAGVLMWLTGKRRNGPDMTEMISDDGLQEVAHFVRRLGDADPSDFTVTETLR